MTRRAQLNGSPAAPPAINSVASFSGCGEVETRWQSRTGRPSASVRSFTTERFSVAWPAEAEPSSPPQRSGGLKKPLFYSLGEASFLYSRGLFPRF